MDMNAGNCSMATQGSTNNFVMPRIKEEPIDSGYNSQNSTSHFQVPHIKPEPIDTGYETNTSSSCPSNDCQGVSKMGEIINIKPEPNTSNYPTNNGPEMIQMSREPINIQPETNVPNYPMNNGPNMHQMSLTGEPINIKPEPKTPKKGRKKKVKTEIKQEPITEHMVVKKKRDRFKGMTEEEVLQRVLPDHLKEGLDIAIIGINPGLTAAFVGHHYAGPGNHFWKCLYMSGLIPEPLNAYDDHKLLEYGIGFTNIVERTSRGSADLTRKEIKEGGEILLGKIQKYKPRIAVFNGKGIYEVFCGHKNFAIGKQPEPFPGCPETAVFVMPSSSARFTQLPRAVDKVPFYVALKKFRDHLRGDLEKLDDTEICFPDLDLKVKVKKEVTEEGVEGEVKEVKEKPKRTRKRRSKGASADETQAKIKTEDMMSQSMPNMYPHHLGQQSWGNHMMGTNFMPPATIKQEPGTHAPGLSASYHEPSVASRHPYWNSLSYSTPRPQAGANQSFQVKQENTSDYSSFGGMSGNNGATPLGQSWPSLPNPNVSYPFVSVGQNFFDQSTASSMPRVVSQYGITTHGFNPNQSSQSLSSSLQHFSHHSTPNQPQGPSNFSPVVTQNNSALNLSVSQNFSPVNHSSPINTNASRYPNYPGNDSALNLTTNQQSPGHQSTPLNSQPSVQPQPPKLSPVHSQASPMPGLSPPQTQTGPKETSESHPATLERCSDLSGLAQTGSEVRDAINASFQY